MPKSKHKKDKLGNVLAPSCQPNIKEESTNDLNPAFCFKHNNCKGYTVKDLQKNAKVSLLDHLHILGQKTWAEIQITSRGKNGHEKISVTSLKKKIYVPEEQDFVLSFRFSSGRIIGFRAGQTFYITAIDTKYDCYNH